MTKALHNEFTIPPCFWTSIQGSRIAPVIQEWRNHRLCNSRSGHARLEECFTARYHAVWLRTSHHFSSCTLQRVKLLSRGPVKTELSYTDSIMHNELFQEGDNSYVDGPKIFCYNAGMLTVIANTNSKQFTASQCTSSYNLILSDMAHKHIFVPSKQVASDIILKMYNYRYHHGGRTNLLWSS